VTELPRTTAGKYDIVPLRSVGEAEALTVEALAPVQAAS
jgi:hypothetical protein